VNRPLHDRVRIPFVLLSLALLAAFGCSPKQAEAKKASNNAEAAPKPIAATNAAPAATNVSPPTAKPPATTNVVTAPPGQSPVAATNVAGLPMTAQTPSTGAPVPGSTNRLTAPGKTDSTNNPASDEIQLSFQGANIEMVVQWLAKTTGKSVVKHPRVQCQLTIVSSKKLLPREAVNLVYRALALEGFTTVESSKSILIVPEGQEPKMSPELVNSSALPEGRQRLVRVFPLSHVTPSEVREKIRPVLSEKAGIETDDHGNQLIITDYTDNIRLAGELIQELDVASSSDSVIEIFPLKHSDADELAALMALVLNGTAAPPSSGGSSGPSPSPMSMGGPGGPGGPMGGPMMSRPGPSISSSSPSSSLSSQVGNQIRLWPDKTANRLIVAAPKSKIPEVKRLLEILDTEKPAEVSVRVIPLKNVTADDLVKEIGPLYQRMSGKSVKDIIEVTSNNRSNSLIVLSSEPNFLAIQKLVNTLDTEEAQEKVMQTFPLKNADAEDVAKQLQDLSQDQDNSSSRFFYYFSPFSNRSGKKMSVVSDRRRNTVIVQAPPGQMENIKKLIKALDEPVTDNALAPKIYPLKYVSAVDIEDVLNELFLKKQQSRSYWDYAYDSDFGGGSSQQKDAGRLYGKVRITSEPYSNSIIVTSNSPENLNAVEDVLKQLDVPSQAGDTTLRVNLKFSNSTTLASSLNILFARGGSPQLRAAPQPGQPQDGRGPAAQQNNTEGNFEIERETKEDAYYPWLGGPQENNYRGSDGRNSIRPVSDLVGRVRVVPDKRTNSLLITSNVHFFAQVLKLINELDAPTPQVLIEAKIIEVSSDFRDRFGVRWSPDGARTFDSEDMDDSVQMKGSAAYTKVFAGSKLADALKTGVLDSSVHLDFLVQFLRKNADATVLAEPQLNIADNELGKLFVGARVPFIYNSQNTEVGGRNDSFQYKDVGVILEVTPHINNAEEVALKIRAESSNIRDGVTLFGGAVLDTRNFRTDLMVKSGETVVLGGIIQREQSTTIRKVPLLGDIPWLGWAFKKKDKLTRDIELMVFLRPKITRTPEDAKALIEEIDKKAPRIKKWQETNPHETK